MGQRYRAAESPPYRDGGGVRTVPGMTTPEHGPRLLMETQQGWAWGCECGVGSDDEHPAPNGRRDAERLLAAHLAQVQAPPAR